MQKNGGFAEYFNIHPAIFPVDSQTGANNGLVVSLKAYAGAAVVLFKGIGIAGDDPVVTMKQATAVAGTGAKALNTSRVWSKLSATTVPGTWTLTEQAAGATYTDDTSAEKKGIILLDVLADDLDIANGYDCIQLTVPDTGAGGAQLFGGLYILYGPRYGGVAGEVSPIAD